MSDEWVLVPREPTEAMFSASSFQEWDTFEQEWRAMLYAAPAAPAGHDFIAHEYRKGFIDGQISMREQLSPAAPQQAKPVAWLGINPRSGHTELCDSKPAPSVMRDFRVRPLYLHPPADEVQQAEPVAWAVFDPSGEVVYAALYKIRCVEYADNEYRYGHSAAKNWVVRPVFAHPTAAEVQRLRDAARLALDALTCGYGDDPDGTHSCGRCDSSVDRNSVARAALRRALEGK